MNHRSNQKGIQRFKFQVRRFRQPVAGQRRRSSERSEKAAQCGVGHFRDACATAFAQFDIITAGEVPQYFTQGRAGQTTLIAELRLVQIGKGAARAASGYPNESTRAVKFFRRSWCPPCVSIAPVREIALDASGIAYNLHTIALVPRYARASRVCSDTSVGTASRKCGV